LCDLEEKEVVEMANKDKKKEKKKPKQKDKGKDAKKA
jgi:hypothetical protein